MPKYLVELSLLTRSAALVVVETDFRPDRSDMREIYGRYEADDWSEDPNYGAPGEHAVLGEISPDGRQCPGIADEHLAKLPVIKMENSDA
jgi:hypothetical protein